MTQDANAGEKRIRELQEALAVHLAEGDLKAAGDDLGYLGRATAASRRQKRAVLYFESALTAHRGLGDVAGAFLDLQSQGEAFLGIQGQLGAAVAALKQAAELGGGLRLPEAELLEGRYEVILRQLEERFPQKAAELRQALVVDAEAVRVDGVHEVMFDPGLALAFFDDQLALARLLEDLGGVFSCLGSEAQLLADVGELEAAIASFTLAQDAACQLEGSGSRGELDAVLSEWRAGLIDAAAGEGAFEKILLGASRDAERLRRSTVARLLA